VQVQGNTQGNALPEKKLIAYVESHLLSSILEFGLVVRAYGAFVSVVPAICITFIGLIPHRN
jgi:hypothetical protein